MRFSELKQKEVINVNNGRRLGCVSDLEIDVVCGQVCAIIVPGIPKLTRLFRNDCGGLVIPWGRVVKLGDDVILVDVDDGFGEVGG